MYGNNSCRELTLAELEEGWRGKSGQVSARLSCPPTAQFPLCGRKGDRHASYREDNGVEYMKNTLFQLSLQCPSPFLKPFSFYVQTKVNRTRFI